MAGFTGECLLWGMRLLSRPFGAVAQLGERLLCKQEVTSSILVGSTNWDFKFEI